MRSDVSVSPPPKIAPFVDSSVLCHGRLVSAQDPRIVGKLRL